MDSEKMVTQKLRNYAVTAKDGGFKTWAEAMLWAAECIDWKYGTEECEGCADRDEEIDRLKDALRLAADEPNIDKARRIADAALMHNALGEGRERGILREASLSNDVLGATRPGKD